MALWKDIARQCQSLPRFSFCVLSPSRIPTEQLTTRQFRYCSTKNESESSGGPKKSFKDMMDSNLWKMAEKDIQAEVATKSYDILKTIGGLIFGMLVTVVFFIERNGRKLEHKMEANMEKHEKKMEASMEKHEKKMEASMEKHEKKLEASMDKKFGEIEAKNEKLAAAIDLILVHLKLKN